MNMENKNNFVSGKEAINGMLIGINKVVDAIKLSYGPKGINAVIQSDLFPGHLVANDCETIIQAMHLEDPIEMMGLSLLKELSNKSHRDSGDGRKTCILIASEILNSGFKSDLSGMELKRELDNLIPIIENEIDKQKQTITEEEVYKVATIAGESKEIGELLGGIYKQIGKDGIIILEGSGTFNTSYSTIDGIRFTDSGYLSPYMVHDESARKDGRKETKAIYENPTILVTKKKISHLNDINPLITTLNKQGKKDLVIFTDDMDSGVASIMVKAHQDKIMNILIIKAPVLWKNFIFEDFAKVTGATIVEDATGINFKNLEPKHLGTCEKITVDKEETVVISNRDISEHIAELKADASNDSKLRLSWLQTKTAILKLGANSESELSYRRLKCEDAINASRLALKDGVVEGGGRSLFLVADLLTHTVGGEILNRALKAPHDQNLKNMGLECWNWGDDVVDAAAVTKNAVRNAIALASTVLTCGVVISFPQKNQATLIGEALSANKYKF